MSTTSVDDETGTIKIESKAEGAKKARNNAQRDVIFWMFALIDRSFNAHWFVRNTIYYLGENADINRSTKHATAMDIFKRKISFRTFVSTVNRVINQFDVDMNKKPDPKYIEIDSHLRLLVNRHRTEMRKITEMTEPYISSNNVQATRFWDYITKAMALQVDEHKLLSHILTKNHLTHKMTQRDTRSMNEYLVHQFPGHKPMENQDFNTPNKQKKQWNQQWQHPPNVMHGQWAPTPNPQWNGGYQSNYQGQHGHQQGGHQRYQGQNNAQRPYNNNRQRSPSKPMSKKMAANVNKIRTQGPNN